MQMRDAIFNFIYEKYMSSGFEDVFILSNDFGSPKLDDIRSDFGKNFINCGISEQNQIGVGAGMAKFGLYPVFYSIASFYMRAAEQIKVDIAVPNLPSMFLGVGAGYGYSADGPTHHSIEDYGLFNQFDEFSIVVPLSNASAIYYFENKMNSGRPTYLRLDREVLTSIIPNPNGFHFYKMQTDPAKRKKLIISCGYLGLSIHHGLRSGSADLLLIEDFDVIKSPDLRQLVSEYDVVLSVEEHVLNTGLAALLARHGVAASTGSFTPLGLTGPSRFGYNHRNKLWEDCGVDVNSVVKKIEEA